MLIKLYAHELPHIHFTAFAPGVIRTPMVEHILSQVDREAFPSAQKLADSDIVSPDEGASRLINHLDKLLEYESGSFIDVRTM